MVGKCGDFVIFAIGSAAVVVCCSSVLFNPHNAEYMVTLKIGKHTIKIYDSIDELPIVRFHKYQKFLLIDSGIGGTIAQFDQRIEKTRRFLMAGKPEQAQKELENMRQCVYMIQSGMSPRHLSFAALVAELDGRVCADLSDEALKKIVEELNDVPENKLTDHLESVKKKIDSELVLCFPSLFNDAQVKEYYGLMRQRAKTILDNIAKGEIIPDGTEEVSELTTKLITYSNPQVFYGSESAEIQFEKEFENLCLLLAGELNVKPKEFTVMVFYNAFIYLQEKAKAREKAQKYSK